TPPPPSITPFPYTTLFRSTVNIEADPSLAGDVDTDIRTFYHRYVGTDVLCSPGNCPLFVTNPWNEGIGDQREPLGLKYAARWFRSEEHTSELQSRVDLVCR